MQPLDSCKTAIVFTDVDGTLVGADHHPIPSPDDTFARVAARIPLCLVSARSPEGLYTIQRALNFQGPLTCFSGAYVLDGEGEELFSQTLTVEDAQEICDIVARLFPNIAIGAYGFHDWYVRSRNCEAVRREEAAVQFEAKESDDLLAPFRGRSLHKLLLMGERDEIMQAQPFLAERFRHLTVERSSQILCEVMSRGVNKAHAVRLLCDHYGVDVSGAIAFGDGCNDIDMLEEVPHSFAMANAEDEVKKVAWKVLPWTNVERGVERTLRQLVLA